HVRHQTKYLDMPAAEGQAFVFATEGRSGPRVRTLKTFVGFLVTIPGERLEGHLRRHDFSRWIRDVFRDHPLAAHLRGLEDRVDTDEAGEIAGEIGQAIRARYETATEREAVPQE